MRMRVLQARKYNDLFIKYFDQGQFSRGCIKSLVELIPFSQKRFVQAIGDNEVLFAAPGHNASLEITRGG